MILRNKKNGEKFHTDVYTFENFQAKYISQFEFVDGNVNEASIFNKIKKAAKIKSMSTAEQIEALLLKEKTKVKNVK